MEVYLVGGAVRDRLLGRPVAERDWVVVGATPAELEAQGFLPVGRDFPVFLHPTTREEYALARLERKTAPGYRGFVTDFSPTVTLEEDLQRRDLTINAIAQAADGRLIDPCGGRRDLEARVLRHVSPAFVEDPVRILRAARFAARFAPLGFTVAPETLQLMRSMVERGEADALVPERVWKELERALGEPCPDVFVQVLCDCGALRVLLPEVDALFGVPQPAKHHPEIDTGLHVLAALRCAAARGASVPVRFAVLVHDLGKARTPPERWPSHPGHEDAGLEPLQALATRLRVPNDCRELAELVMRYHTHVHRALELRPETLLKLLEATDAFRRPQRFTALLEACECDARGRLGLEARDYPQPAWLEAVRAAAATATLEPAARTGLSGAEIGAALRRQRLAAITALKASRAGPAS
ncbi:MAG: multifunctional CCA addition/repair protein [Sinobacteraceae bacterium]|nr:multifunctional CCA addition/repair protein [Nevskiaceae bacterium]MCP5471129.1 multifunctional CCA addition/repair protein [Nevskiaceae bacterium]